MTSLPSYVLISPARNEAQFIELTTYVQLDKSTHPFTVSLGNPNLKPEHAKLRQ
jgi:hypothetical protein